ncbi:MAG: DUF4169 family protein [Pseudomonadota bacterium]
MAGDLINLNKARKERDRSTKAARAAENRVKHGRTKVAKHHQQADASRLKTHLDAHKRDEPDDVDGARGSAREKDQSRDTP